MHMRNQPDGQNDVTSLNREILNCTAGEGDRGPRIIAPAASKLLAPDLQSPVHP